MLGNKILRFKKIYKFAFYHFFIGFISFLLFSKNVFMNLKNSIFPPEYMRYRKSVKKKNCLFQKDLQIFYWPFFHRTYIFCLFMKNVIENKTFGLQKTTRDTNKNVEDKIVYFKKTYKFFTDYFLSDTQFSF